MWDDLPEEILVELRDPEFVNRMHGKPSCYGKGCHGPLCRRAVRLKNRRKYESQRVSAGKPYQPDERVRVQDDIDYGAILRWHWSEVASRRIEEWGVAE